MWTRFYQSERKSWSDFIKRKNMKTQTIRCERCGEILKPNRVKWLELSQTDGRYYVTIPLRHVSQGAFTFGSACAKAQLKETKAQLIAKLFVKL